MASNTVVKNERFSDIDDNDPLAELSRIMGLDKRNETDASDDVDFGIDLEKELLGEAEVAASAPAAAVDDLDIDFDTAFADFDEVVEPAAVAEPAPVAVAPTPVADDSSDDFSGDFANVDLLTDEMDTSFVATETPAPVFAAPEPVFVAPEPVFAAPEADVADDLPVVPTADELYVEAIANAPPVETVADDFDAVQSLEAELGALLGNHTAPVAQEPLAVAPVENEIQPVEAVASDWQIDDFELAAAEVESVVEAEDLPDPISAPVAYEAEPAVAFDEPAMAHAVAATVADDFELELDDFDALAPVDEPVEAIEADEVVAAAEPIALAPEAIVAASQKPVIDELEAAIADFENDAAWDGPVEDEFVAAPVPAPVRLPEPIRFGSTPRTQPAAVAPPSDDDDPFAALAALAAAPPIMKTLGRSNPVASSAVAERPRPAPIEGLRPVEPVAPQRAQPAWPFLTRSTQPPAERPAPRPAPVAAAPRPAAPAQPVAPPVAPVVANANPYRDLRPAAPTQPVAHDMPVVAPSFARDPEPAARPASPAWLTAGHAPAARAETPRIERAPAYAPAPRAAPVAAAPVVAAAAAPALDDLDFELGNLIDDIDLAPELETIDFNDDAVALADDFDIPELAQEETVPGHADLDDFESDFADAFNQLSAKPAAAAAPSWRQANVAPVAEAPGNVPYGHAADTMLDEDFSAYQRQMETDSGAFDDQGDFSVPVYEDEEPAARPASRLPLYGAIFAGLALLVAGGAYAWSTFGEAGNGEPALVRADASPIKVKPETPGGVVVPNQNGKVYEQVAGGARAAAPAQEKLISTVEEPIVPESRPTASALPGVESPQIKSEERVTAADTSDTGTSAEETAAIATKKVRTMIVKPDGTLVEREVPADAAPTATVAAAPAANQPAAPVAAAPAQTSPEQTSTIASIAPVIVPTAEEPAASAEEPVAAAPAVEAPAAETPKAAVPAKPVKTTTIKPKPVAEAKPAPEPEPTVELAGGPAAAAAPIAGDFWTVQIASQPSREGAQASYEALANRYGGVLGGKGVNIVQADVKGKPMWRVRIPAASKGDANILCAKLKTAGGSCFVSK